MLSKDTTKMKQVNMIGITTYFLSKNCSQNWIVDSSATHYVSAIRHMFQDGRRLSQCHKDKLHLPTGAEVDISHTGEAYIFGDKLIKDVLFVP